MPQAERCDCGILARRRDRAARECVLPAVCADTGAIVAGRLRDGVYVATGHTCWGILNGPATGQGMAELMLNGPDGKAAQLLAPFAPRV